MFVVAERFIIPFFQFHSRRFKSLQENTPVTLLLRNYYLCLLCKLNYKFLSLTFRTLPQVVPPCILPVSAPTFRSNLPGRRPAAHLKTQPCALPSCLPSASNDPPSIFHIGILLTSFYVHIPVTP